MAVAYADNDKEERGHNTHDDNFHENRTRISSHSIIATLRFDKLLLMDVVPSKTKILGHNPATTSRGPTDCTVTPLFVQPSGSGVA